ncbi:MAG: hypothetical protein M0P31_09370 [Solirubrobacteraceae bacterium]|nr:hypothetical protein [Solirubrobacteraceae bacterium]
MPVLVPADPLPRPHRPARRITVALLAALGAAVAVAPAAAHGALSDPVKLTVEPNDSPLDGHDGWLLWSRRGDDGRYRLVVRRPDGTAAVLPVTPASGPLDASIGPGPDGAPLVVYRACERPTPDADRECDIRRIDPATGGDDRPVIAASRSGVDEGRPAVWGSRIAFARPIKAGRTRRQGIVVADLDADSPAGRPTILGPVTESRRGRRVRARTSRPESLDLRDGRVAFVWRTAGPGDRSRLMLASDASRPRPRTLLTVRTTARTVSALGRPAMGATDVIVPKTRSGGGGRSTLERRSLRSGRGWSLRSGFSAAQTERYGSSLSAVARLDDASIVVVRRLASDGRHRCAIDALPGVEGCEVVRLDVDRQPWRRVD